MFSICYVLVDDENLKYYHELLISAYSVRYRGYTGVITVLTDQQTNNCLIENGSKEYEELDLKLVIVDVPAGLSIKEISRYIKTGCREYVQGDMLFLDTDTIAVRELPEEVSTGEIAFALDEHWPRIGGSSETVMPEKSAEAKKRRIVKCGYEYDSDNPYYNSGCIWSRDTEFTHRFFREWREEWNKCRLLGVVFDQVSLFYLTTKYSQQVCELNGIWNVSVCAPQGMKYLENAIIIHYWNQGCSVYRLSDSEVQKKGYRSEEVRDIIANPLSAFYPSKIVRAESSIESDFQTTSTYLETIDLYKNRFQFFRCINFLFSLRGKIRHMRSKKKTK